MIRFMARRSGLAALELSKVLKEMAGLAGVARTLSN
jgi:hypothetical protein